MTTIVTDTGFTQEDWGAGILTFDQLKASDTGGHAVDISSDTDPEAIRPFLHQIAMIRVAFPSFADGRGFSIARRLRLMGFRGRLRAAGHVLSDQYPNARRSGFDEVEIDADLAARQPEPQWRTHADWRDHDYQARLRRSA